MYILSLAGSKKTNMLHPTTTAHQLSPVNFHDVEERILGFFYILDE